MEAAVDDEDAKTAEACLARWKKELCKLADKHAQDTKHYLEAAEELHRPQKCQVPGPNAHAYNAPLTARSSGSSTATTTSVRTRTPALTQNECALLNKHQGCTKC
jgi:hypothetical protein